MRVHEPQLTPENLPGYYEIKNLEMYEMYDFQNIS